jgi:tetrahedral aminopeptidase
MIDLKQHLKTLSEAHGVSGYEDAIRALVQDAWTPLVDSFETGKLGDLIAVKPGSGTEPRPRLMLCAHMDEIGMIVKNIRDGFLMVGKMGGIDARTLPGLPVIVHGRRPLPGVVALPAMYDPAANSTEYAKLTDLVIDLGLPAEEVSALVRVGDVITLDAPTLELAGKRLAGKAMDDRACIAVITRTLELLQGRTHQWDVIAVATTSEEVGSHGAATVAAYVQPDAAIALDVTFARQAGVSHGSYGYGAGVPVSLGANFHPVLYSAILDAAERLEITTLADPLPDHSGTDAWPIQIAGQGIPSALVNLVIRNMHTTVETVDLGDIERTARLLAGFIADLERDFVKKLRWNDEE